LRRLLDLLRWAPFLDEDRVLSYVRVWVIGQIGFGLLMIGAFLRDSASHRGLPTAMDLSPYWAAAHFALEGQAWRVYDETLIAGYEHAHLWIGTDPTSRLPFLYPPCFLLLVLPLGYLAYPAAVAAFLGTGYALLAAGLRLAARRPAAVIALTLSPAMVMNALVGQNGAYSAACFAAAMGLLRARPALAGAVLGLLVCKPHFALLIPVALAVARRWRAFFACGATALALCAVSLWLFGPETWVEFVHHAGGTRAVLEDYPELWPKIQSLFGAVRLLGGSVTAGYAAYALGAVGALGTLLVVCGRRAGAEAEMAVLVVATLLSTPYFLDYDLTCLLVPMAYIGTDALRRGWLAWEKTALLVLYVVPMFARLTALETGIPLVPPLMALLLLLCARRALWRDPVAGGTA